jgi:hypothetical protein
MLFNSPAINRMLLADAIRSRGRSEASHPPRIIARVYRLLLYCSDYARIAKCPRGETQTGTMP